MLVIFAVPVLPYMSSQKGEFILLGSAQYKYVHVCLTALVLEESILLVTLLHMLSLIVNIYDKRNICQSFKGCRQTFKDYKLTFVYALVSCLII